MRRSLIYINIYFIYNETKSTANNRQLDRPNDNSQVALKSFRCMSKIFRFICYHRKDIWYWWLICMTLNSQEVSITINWSRQNKKAEAIRNINSYTRAIWLAVLESLAYWFSQTSWYTPKVDRKDIERTLRALPSAFWKSPDQSNITAVIL